MDTRLQQVPQQQLLLTPGLKLSLEVLQLPLAQLYSYFQQQLEENPVLELKNEYESSHVADRLLRAEDQADESWGHRNGHDTTEAEEPDEPRRPEIAAAPPSLYEHLLIQLRCTKLDESIARAAETLAEWLDQDGYLRPSLEEIARTEQLTLSELEQGLEAVQQLDPPGVGGRTLAECLLIQLRHRRQSHSLAAKILQDHFELFAKRRLKSLASHLRVSLAQIQDACRLITQLDPKPARNFSSSSQAIPLIPDLIVYQTHGEFQVELNDSSLPHVILSRRYRALLHDTSTPPEAKQFIRQKVRHAVWFLKAIHQRHETLLAIGQRLVELEHDYLTYGISHLTPLTQEELAGQIGCHASTISRAIAGKTMQTPFGIVPLHLFFGGSRTHSSSATHAKLSARTIHAEIAQLLATEDPACPLSDQAIADSLKARGISVARRTVAKYRIAMKRLPAHLRKNRF